MRMAKCSNRVAAPLVSKRSGNGIDRGTACAREISNDRWLVLETRRLQVAAAVPTLVRVPDAVNGGGGRKRSAAHSLSTEVDPRATAHMLGVEQAHQRRVAQQLQLLCSIVTARELVADGGGVAGVTLPRTNRQDRHGARIGHGKRGTSVSAETGSFSHIRRRWHRRPLQKNRKAKHRP